MAKKNILIDREFRLSLTSDGDIGPEQEKIIRNFVRISMEQTFERLRREFFWKMNRDMLWANLALYVSGFLMGAVVVDIARRWSGS